MAQDAEGSNPFIHPSLFGKAKKTENRKSEVEVIRFSIRSNFDFLFLNGYIGSKFFQPAITVLYRFINFLVRMLKEGGNND